MEHPHRSEADEFEGLIKEIKSKLNFPTSVSESFLIETITETLLQNGLNKTITLKVDFRI